MSTHTDSLELPEGLLELKQMMEAEWPRISAGIVGPRMEGEGGEGDGEGEGEGSEGEGGEDDEPTLEELQTELAESRKEQAKLKRQLAAAKGAATKATKKTATKKDDEGDDDETKAELAAEKERATKLENQLRDLQAESIARDLKFVDAGDAVRLLDWDEIADPTDRKEVRDALKRLKKEKPHLAAAATEGGGTGAGRGTRSGGGAGQSMNDLIRNAATGRGR